jgi:5-(carboxyamino)imidazole ribonucleotide synthase
MLAKILGIIGGGQLGLMLTEAAKTMPEYISEIIVLDPTQNCPASKAGARQIIGDFKDENAISKLAESCDIITYEIESGNSDVLKKLENKCVINPSPETLKIIQDKLRQKEFLSKHQIAVAEFHEINTLNDLKKSIEYFGLPVLLKVRKDAYDGRGNYKITSSDEIETAYASFDNKELMVEKYIDFKMEVSVIAGRNTNAEIITFPIVENIHEENILRMTIAPARVSDTVRKRAESIAHKTMEVLKGAGIFGIEMFVTDNDEILINEIAPRVHNSGHHTLQSSKTSQFEQHLRAIFGLKLGSTELIHRTIMYNILGPSDFHGKYKPITINANDVFLKMYGKEISKPKRKLGHFNVVDIDNSKDIEKLISRVNEIKDSVSFENLA